MYLVLPIGKNIGKRFLESIDKHFESKCLQQNVDYKATITTNSEIKVYIGSTGGPFKKNGIHTLVTLKMRRTTELNFRRTYGN